MNRSLLVVVGEASGDRAAAEVLAELRDVPTFGVGGPACAAAGLRRVAELSMGSAGLFAVGRSLGQVARALAALVSEARRARPSAALLVDYTEFNMLLAPRLRAIGTKVLWYVAPQVWAWRPSRLVSLPERVDALAVILPFEERLWREAGVDAEYVGHPVAAAPLRARAEIRAELGVFGKPVALLPGSRPSEVAHLLEPLLDAAVRLRRDDPSVDPRLVLAATLERPLRADAVAKAAAVGIRAVDAPPEGALGLLPAFDAALCASGTACLEAALAGAPPVVTYRTDRLTALVVGAALRTPFVGLPNVLLGRPAYPEVLQHAVTGPRLAAELRKVLERRARFEDAARELRACLGRRNPRSRIAQRLRAWIDPSAPPPHPPNDRASTTSSSR